MDNARKSSLDAPPLARSDHPLPWLIVGLDVPDLDQARPLVRALAGKVGALKIGPVLFTRAGPAAIDLVHEHGGRVFLDLKWHDIPNTVAGACRAAAAQGVWMVNVHAAGGERMLAAAREALEQGRPPGIPRPHLLAVTVLTSLDDADLPAAGVTGTTAQQVERLAGLAVNGGVDGLVASGHEVARLHARWPHLSLVVPGVRPRWLAAAGPTASADDQRRIATPVEVLGAGARYIVIARPIITHPDPVLAVGLTEQEVAARLSYPLILPIMTPFTK